MESMSLVMTLQYILKIKDILPVLYGNIPLAIYFTYGNKYVSTLLSIHPTLSFGRVQDGGM